MAGLVQGLCACGDASFVVGPDVHWSALLHYSTLLYSSKDISRLYPQAFGVCEAALVVWSVLTSIGQQYLITLLYSTLRYSTLLE